MPNNALLQNFIADLKSSKSSFKRQLGQSLDYRSTHGISIEVTKHGSVYEYVSLEKEFTDPTPLVYKLEKIKVDTDSQQKILNQYRSWSYPERGLYVSGNMGSGKTTMMDAMYDQLRMKRKDLVIKWFEYPELATGLNDRKSIVKLTLPDITKEVTAHEFYNYHCKNSNVLFIDDFLRVDHPFHPVDNLLEILNYRGKFALPTFYTSNLDINGVHKVSAAVGERLLEHTKSMKCVTDESYRLRKQREYQKGHD